MKRPMGPVAGIAFYSALAAGLAVPANYGGSGAFALVGPSAPAGSLARHTVMVLRNGPGISAFCSGVVIAPRIVLTAAHCVSGSPGQVAIYAPTNGEPRPIVAQRIIRHPEYVPNAIKLRRRSIDLALVMASESLPAPYSPARIARDVPVRLDSNYVIAGYGLRQEGEEKTGGELRTGRLIAQAPLSSILLWARDAEKRGLGACTGDSGGPIFESSSLHLVAITVWSTGPRGRQCGDLTQAALVAPQSGWINTVLRQWSAR